MSAMIAPRIEIYTTLACRVHKPDIFEQSFPGLELGLVDASRVFGQLPHTDSSGLSIDQIHRLRLTDNSGRTTRENPTTKPNRCASDPVVQAAVAKLTAGAFAIFIPNAYCLPCRFSCLTRPVLLVDAIY